MVLALLLGPLNRERECRERRVPQVAVPQVAMHLQRRVWVVEWDVGVPCSSSRPLGVFTK